MMNTGNIKGIDPVDEALATVNNMQKMIDALWSDTKRRARGAEQPRNVNVLAGSVKRRTSRRRFGIWTTKREELAARVVVHLSQPLLLGSSRKVPGLAVSMTHKALIEQFGDEPFWRLIDLSMTASYHPDRLAQINADVIAACQSRHL